MVNTHAFDEILAALRAGTPVAEIAQDLTETLNAAEAEYNKARNDAILEELVDQINVALQKYSVLYGNKKPCTKLFTVDEIKQAFEAKIQGKNLACGGPAVALKKPTLQEFVDNMSDEEMQDAWKDTLNSLITLFSK